MKRWLFICISIFLLTGCTSYTELNELSIVNTLGIDYQENKYQLTVNVMDGNLDDGKIEEKITTYTSQGTTLEEAFQMIYRKSEKRIYLSHIDLLILTEDAINNHLIDIIENFLQNNEYRNNFNVVLLKDISLKDFMEKKLVAEQINNLLNTNYKETAMTKPQDLETMMQELLMDKNTYLPTITDQNDEIFLRGLTLIKNNQILEELTIEDTILFNLLKNTLHKTTISPYMISENQTLVTTKKNEIYFHFHTIVNQKDDFEKQMKSKLLSFLTKYQQKDYDILKLTQKIYQNDYHYYQQTPNLLSKLNFHFSFEIKEKENYLQGELFYETR